MPPPSEKLIERIKKLLRLGDSGVNPSEMEVEAAVSKARQLMAEHALSMADLHLDNSPDSDVIQSRMRRHQTYTRKGKLADYDYIVASAVAALTDTRWVRYAGATPEQKKEFPWTKLEFWGDEADVAVASELFFILLEIVRRRSREVYGSRGWDKRHTAYAVGFAARLEHRARMLAATSPANKDKMALVLYNKALAVTTYVDKHVMGVHDVPRVPKDKEVHEHWRKGYADGGTVSLDKTGIRAGHSIRTRNRG